MAGYSLVPGSFPVLAAKLKQKGREGLGTRLRWVYDPVSVYFYQWLLIMFMCMVKNCVTLSFWKLGGEGGILFFFFFFCFAGIRDSVTSYTFVHCCALTKTEKEARFKMKVHVVHVSNPCYSF